MSTHGLTGYKQHRCRCDVCRAASRAHAKKRYRQIGYGTWNPLVDAEPARTHVRQLMADGLGFKRVAALAGVSVSTVSTLLYGKPGRNPTARLRPEVAAKLLQVQADLDSKSAARPTDATGTRRRLQALVAAGWPQEQLANRLGMTQTNFGRMLSGRQVFVRTARAVIALYDELWEQEPTTSASSKARAINYAKARKWAPPQAWDDDTIDDPPARPQNPTSTVRTRTRRLDIDHGKVDEAVAGTRIQLTIAERREVVAHLHSLGLNDQSIQRRTGISDRTVLRIREELQLPAIGGNQLAGVA